MPVGSVDSVSAAVGGRFDGQPFAAFPTKLAYDRIVIGQANIFPLHSCSDFVVAAAPGGCEVGSPASLLIEGTVPGLEGRPWAFRPCLARPRLVVPSMPV